MMRKGRRDVSHAGPHGVAYESLRHSKFGLVYSV